MKKTILSIIIIVPIVWIFGLVLAYMQIPGYDGPEPVASNFTAFAMLVIAALVGHTTYVIIGSFLGRKKKEDWTTSVESVKDYYYKLLLELKKHFLKYVGSVILFGFVILISLSFGAFFVFGLVPFDLMQKENLSYLWTSLLTILAILWLFIVGIWTLKKVKKINYKKARFLYLVKMIPFLIYIFIVIVLTGGDVQTFVNFNSSDSDPESEWSSAGSCDSIFGSMIKPRSVTPAHASINERVEKIEVEFVSGIDLDTIDDESIKFYFEDENDSEIIIDYDITFKVNNRQAVLDLTSALVSQDIPQVYTLQFDENIRGDFFEDPLSSDCYASFIVGDPSSEDAKELSRQLVDDLGEFVSEDVKSVKIF